MHSTMIMTGSTFSFDRSTRTCCPFPFKPTRSVGRFQVRPNCLADKLAVSDRSLEQAEKLASGVIRGWLYESRVFRSKADAQIDTLAAKILPKATQIRDRAEYLAVPAYLGQLRSKNGDSAEVLRLEQLERDMCVFSDLVCQQAEVALLKQPNLRAKQARKYVVGGMIDALENYRLKHRKGTIDTVLDIGFGSGYTSSYLAKRYMNAQVIGLEASAEAVALRDVKQDHRQANLEWRYGFAEQTNLTPGSIDLITMLYVTQQMPVAALSRACFEAVKILRPGGTLMIAHPTAVLLPSWVALLNAAQTMGIPKQSLLLRAINQVCEEVAGGGIRHPDCTAKEEYKTVLSDFFDFVTEKNDLFPGHQILFASNKSLESQSLGLPPANIGRAMSSALSPVIGTYASQQNAVARAVNIL